MKTPLSPKVVIAVVVGIVLTSVVSNISAITPEMFDFLGAWKLFWFGTFITTLIGFAAFWKTDPLRVLPADVNADQEAAAAALVAKQTSVAATTADAPAKSFAPTQAKIDAQRGTSGMAFGVSLPVDPIVTPETAPDVPAAVAPTPVAPVFTPPAV